MEYKVTLDVIFKGKIPTSIKNCPSFTEKKLEETLQLHFLTKEGLLVFLYFLYFFLIFLKGFKKNSMGFEGNIFFY